MARALRWDGVIPQVLDPDIEGGARQADLGEVAELRSTIERGPNPGADIIVEGQWTDHSAAAYDRLMQGPPT